MRYSLRNIEIAFGHAGLTHYGGILFFNEFSRMLQLRRFLTRHLRYPRRNHDYQLSQMILSLVYPIILGLDRLESMRQRNAPSASEASVMKWGNERKTHAWESSAAAEPCRSGATGRRI